MDFQLSLRECIRGADRYPALRGGLSSTRLVQISDSVEMIMLISWKKLLLGPALRKPGWVWGDRKTCAAPGVLYEGSFPSAIWGFRRELQVPPLRYPGFPVECSGVDEVRAALFMESRIRGRCWLCEVGNSGTLRSG